MRRTVPYVTFSVSRWRENSLRDRNAPQHISAFAPAMVKRGAVKSFNTESILISRSVDVTKLVNLSRVRDCAVTERVCDAPTGVLTHGAGRLLKQAVEAEADAFIDERRGLKDERGRRRVVRNGYLAPRKIRTCMGEHAVSVPRVRDLAGNIKYKSRILMPYQRHTEGQKDQFSRAYLAGLSSGDFHVALLALLGRRVVCMSPRAVTRLEALWRAEHLLGLDHELHGGSAPISGTMQDWHEKHRGSQGSPNGERTVTIDAAGNRAGDGLVLQKTRRDKAGWLHLLVPNCRT
jgi:hypothetical protein